MAIEQIKQEINNLREAQTWLCVWSSPTWFEYERKIERLTSELKRLKG